MVHLWFCYLIVLHISQIAGDALDDDIYTFFTRDSSPCIRILDKDGRKGCATVPSGTTGALRLVDTEEAKVALFDTTPTPTTVVLDPKLLSNKTVAELSSHLGNHLAGILVLYAKHPPSENGNSGETTNPQSQYSPNDEGADGFEWNPKGDSMLYQEYGFGIVQLSDKESKSILGIAKSNRKSAEADQHEAFEANFNYPMTAKTNSSDCLKQTTCLPIGGHSVWSTYQQNTTDLTNSDVIVLSTRMDATSLFHDGKFAVGAESTLSGLIVLLATADALKAVQSELSGLDKKIVFMSFTGENYGFVGSRKFADDIVNFDCKRESVDGGVKHCVNPYASSLEFMNFNLEQVSHWIGLSQLGISKTREVTPIYLHHQNDLDGDMLAAHLEGLQSFNDDAASGITFAIRNASVPGVPPSSVWAFLNSAKEMDPEIDLNAIVLADHNGAYVNKYYNSHFDQKQNVDARQLCSVSTALARYVYSTAGGIKADSIAANCDTVEDLLQCLAEDMQCDLVKEYDASSRSSPSHYPSVHYIVEDKDVAGTSRFVYRFLAAATASEVHESSCKKFEDCPSDQRCANLTCVTSSTFFHAAVDPALDFNYNTFKWSVPDDKLDDSSFWTESNWQPDIYTKTFQSESPLTELLLLMIGVGVVVAAIFSTCLLKRYCTKTFKIL